MTERIHKVYWEIDVEAASPLEAAKKALETQRDPESHAIVFTIVDPDDGSPHTIDLMEDEHTAAPLPGPPVTLCVTTMYEGPKDKYPVEIKFPAGLSAGEKHRVYAALKEAIRQLGYDPHGIPLL